MAILQSIFAPKQPSDPNEVKPKDLINHHCFGNELLLTGFVCPVALPKDRIEELMEGLSASEMAMRCNMAEDDLQRLLLHEYVEPSPLQYYSIARACRVSVMWLMGYHTIKERSFGTYDHELMIKLTQRNTVENRLYNLPAKGMFNQIIISRLNTKIQKIGIAISFLAARITAEEHIPLSDAELYALSGRPVFLEFMDETACWGIPSGDLVLTEHGPEQIELNEQKYYAFLTPSIRGDAIV